MRFYAVLHLFTGGKSSFLYFHGNINSNTMKYLKIIGIPLAFIGSLALVSLTINTSSEGTSNKEDSELEETTKQSINLFVTHGGCSLPFSGTVSNLVVKTEPRFDQGNPLETMQMNFEIDVNSFKACIGDEYTAEVQTPGLFIDDDNEKLIFRSTNVFTMGLDWYQINGKLSIKGMERDVKFFATGIRNPLKSMPTELILEGQLDLSDWGIDYEQIVHGKSLIHGTKWMHLNMKIDMDC